MNTEDPRYTWTSLGNGFEVRLSEDRSGWPYAFIRAEEDTPTPERRCPRLIRELVLAIQEVLNEEPTGYNKVYCGWEIVKRSMTLVSIRYDQGPRIILCNQKVEQLLSLFA